MKFGKSKLKRILSEETGIPIEDIAIYGQYEYYGNKESLVIGSHTITVMNGNVYLSSPVLYGEEIRYKTRKIKFEHPHEPASSGAL